MTKVEQTPETIIYGNSSATVFPFLFAALSPEHVKLYSVGPAGSLTEVSTTEYSIALLADYTGGSCTFAEAPATETIWLLRRETPYDQLIGVSRVNSYDPKVIEKVWDKLTLLAQELHTMASRSLRIGQEVDPVVLGDQEVAIWDEPSQSFMPGPNLSQISAAVGAAASAVSAAERAEAIADILEAITSSAVLGFNFGPFIGDGVTTTFTLPGTVTGTAQVYPFIDGVAQINTAFSVAGNQLTFATAPKEGEIVFGKVLINSSVASAAADAIQLQSGESVQTYVNRNGSFATRAALVAALAWPWAVGAVAKAGPVEYTYDGASTSIADMPGWKPVGQETPQHWGGGPDASAAENDAAFDACAAYRGAVHVPPGVYQKNTPILFDRRAGSGVQSVYFGGTTGDALSTKIVINTLVATPAIKVDQQAGATVEYGFRAVIENISLEINMGATNNAEANWCAAIALRQCNNSLIRNVVHDGFDVGVDCQRVVQSRFEHITMRTALRSAGNHAKAKFVFDHDRTLLAGTSFGNTVADCESQPTNLLTNVDKTFILRAVDGLEVLGGHYNNARFHFDISPDGTGGRTTVRDCRVVASYMDCDNDAVSPLVAAVNIAAIPSGSVRIFGLSFVGNKLRSKEGQSSNLFRFAGDAGNYDGLLFFKGLTFASNEIVGYDAAIINLSMHSSYDETTLVSEVTIQGNHFRDAGDDSSHAAANKNAVVVRGKNVTVTGNTYVGNWTDVGSAVIAVTDDVDGYLIYGEVFDTNRATPILIDAGVTGVGQSFGHVINGAVASRVLGVVEEGTGANGYYCKYDNSRMVCLKKVSLTAVAITTADGTGFTTAAALSLGNVEKTFSAIPQWFVSPRAIGGFAMPNYGGAGTVSAPPSTKLSRFTSATLDVVVDIRADGTWS